MANTSALLKTILTCLLIMLYMLSEAGNGNKNGSSQYCLEVSGNISTGHHKKQNHSYRVELIQKNQVVQATTVNDDGSFRFRLKKNCDYGIRITKEGYVPRLVTVYTDLPENMEEKSLFRFEFDTDLIPESEKPLLNTDALDFPIAIIHFNEDAGWFYYNEEYTSQIKRKIYGKELAHN